MKISYNISSEAFCGIVSAEVNTNTEETLNEVSFRLINNKVNIEEYGSLLFDDLQLNLSGREKVVFFNDVDYYDFLYLPLNDVSDMFDLTDICFDVGIGGIGGCIDIDRGIHYFIYSRNEHLPEHVHCIKQKKKCKCLLSSVTIEYASIHNHFTSSEEKKIRNYVKANMDRIYGEWRRLNPDLCAT